MKSPALFTIIPFLFALIACLIPLKAYALSIDNVRFGVYPEKTRIVVELDQRAEFRAFLLSNPYRMVVDLPSYDWRAKALKNHSHLGITDIRQGNLKPGISRIVFDLNRPVRILDAFTLPANDQAGKPPRLVIDFANTNQSGFQSALKKTYGALDVNSVEALLAAKPAQTASNTLPTPQSKPASKPASNSKRNAQKPLIIIDPGHGGVDPGAIGPGGIKEKNIALALSKELQKQLLATGQYRVKMTREKDYFIKLGNRVNFARKHEGDLFLSIHADSIRNSKITGASFYTLSEKASDAQAAKLAARENKSDLIAGIDIEVEDEAVMDILLDLARRNTQNQSRYLANVFVDQFGDDRIRLLRNPSRHANFAVLKAPDIPSVLVETGFISNAGEARKLNTPAHRKRIASSLTKSINAYFETVKENEKS